VNKTCEPKKYSSLKSLCLQIFSGTRIHDAVVFPLVILYKYIQAMWMIPDISATEEKTIIFNFSKDTLRVSDRYPPAIMGNTKKTTLGIFNNGMLAPMGISLSEIGTGVPFFQSALQFFTPSNMACKYTRIFCPVLYILGR